jgi:subtilisin family serine protease/subtilisin-like proprotein convertase family protein
MKRSFQGGILMVAMAGAWIAQAAQLAADPQRFEFRFPARRTFLVETRPPHGAQAARPEWRRGVALEDGAELEFGSRIALELETGGALAPLIDGRPVTLVRTPRPGLFILQAPEAGLALAEAARLSGQPGVAACYPVLRRAAVLDGPYAAAPNDPHFPPANGNVIGQWYLENRASTSGAILGADINVRAAWPYTRGEGVTIAIVDNGVELTHPELVDRTAGAPHHNFSDGSTNGFPSGTSASWAHGTGAAGLAAATGNNGYGMIGVAPEVRLASWVIFGANSLLVSDEQLMDMYAYASNIVAVQSHSWGNDGAGQKGPTLLEQAGLDKAILEGRNGRGVVMVRSAGNERGLAANADDDGYPNDPRVIAVAAVTSLGQVASYSEPGACLLVGAPGNDAQGNGLFSTDLTGVNGGNRITFFPPNEYLWDFLYNTLGFGGTSAATPLVAGTVALMLAANPALTYRDVQQVLLLSAGHYDLADTDVTSNGAGLLVSHNIGFGVPDAGAAVALARAWSNRPPLTTVSFTQTNTVAIPDDGQRLVVSGDGIPSGLASIRTVPGHGPHADNPTRALRFMDVGFAASTLTVDLTGKAALIQRGGGVTFAQKIGFAAAAGAEFVAVYNNATNTNTLLCDDTQRCVMGSTDFVPVPAVFIGYNDGVALGELFRTNPTARAQIRLASAGYQFAVTNTLACEHVGVRVQTDHPSRGDLRITLRSPQGTRSVLQRFNSDAAPGPVDWTYWSTHHFYESSAGEWRLEFTDEGLDRTGSVHAVTLILTGVEIVDADHDGLDDRWEQAHFGSLAQGPQDDPDQDGYSNVREQVMGTDPNRVGAELRLDLSVWNGTLARLAWPGLDDKRYEIWGGTNVAKLKLLTTVPGRFPETEWFTPYATALPRFFRVRAIAP